ncbi:MAG TPA: UDP-N-acetylmuramoyl-tripeptide--D-alanyl-D-alanine ligase, partial [Variovorax sp.]|nr:UDP-N-acetylmuramoyl-tripeptide--D-alanyl-D-alanine ligase [Variovorax sp.]
MWPTSRWQPGRIYRDFHGLRPPAPSLLHDALLQLEIGLASNAGPVSRVRMPRHVPFVVRAEQATAHAQGSRAPAPRYRVIPPDALPPELPDQPGQAWNAAQLTAVTGGTWLVEPPPGWFVRSVARGEKFLGLLPAPALFVASDAKTRALHERYAVPQGPQAQDWHEHLARLQPRVAGAMLCRPVDGLDPELPVLKVDDPIQALVELGAAARQRLHGRVVAVTGSAGKTSVCQMLSQAFSSSLRVFSTVDNYNSRVGMLAMLANVPARTDLVVLEAAVSGINAPDFQNIKLVRPDVAVITNIGASHLRDGGTVEDIARRKANIFEGMRPGACAVLCTDTDHFGYLLERARARKLRVLTYGTAASADVRLEAHDPLSGRIRASCGGDEFEYSLGAKGRHMAVNSLVCFAVARALALDDAAVPAQLASFAAVQGRGQLREFPCRGGVFRLFDESYNANPLSMEKALAMVAEEPCAAGRKILVLGDMLELGSDAAQYHGALVASIVRCRPGLVFLHGPLMGALRDRIAAALPPTSAVHAPGTLQDLERTLVDSIAPDDLVLLKASNGMQLWQIVGNLARKQQQATGRAASAPLPPPPA